MYLNAVISFPEILIQLVEVGLGSSEFLKGSPGDLLAGQG